MSLRLRLFLLLSAATGLVWLSAVIWIEHSTRAEVEKVLDARLQEAATMVSSLISDRRIDVAAANPAIRLAVAEGYSSQLSCQIWSLDGGLVGQSAGAPEEQLNSTSVPGFSEAMIDGALWRVYTTENSDLGVRVMVGDALEVRDRLVRGVVEGFLLPAAIILPLLAVLIWFSVAQGLKPLEMLERGLRARSPQDLNPLPDGPAPREIRPVRRALNRLFAEVEIVRATERDFIAFAAHELKTPLAGLRTQAQIARIAQDEETRRHALQTIERSVDRTDRMVRQLLELAAVERDMAEFAPVDLHRLLEDLALDLRGVAMKRDVQIEVCDMGGVTLHTIHFLLHAALRNVLENAIAAAPSGGTVRVSVESRHGEVSISIEDNGSGIAPASLDRITERFFRGAGAKGEGSGLGLAIVASAMERLGGQLHVPPSGRAGQKVRLSFPAKT